ncbi:hypothetical protein FFLO_00895 [Filobasidium floriforme]|uniref:Uncharacterized protein n=1 Tax=Filobasidium floriforme TaxID=5210 RepID=A0A8K0JQR5_9TREE|nr:uncharacterized protein HD553DRAFT_323230 [Filobasidium floriforme]KAG7571222.1 hypothetical protein FFLO_00895 [Filobasidium floriforme]KAH8087061.1 hypothetical protein HD553DRAFT_323230 [Filobasidium floriforme]
MSSYGSYNPSASVYDPSASVYTGGDVYSNSNGAQSHDAPSGHSGEEQNPLYDGSHAPPGISSLAVSDGYSAAHLSGGQDRALREPKPLHKNGTHYPTPYLPPRDKRPPTPEINIPSGDLSQYDNVGRPLTVGSVLSYALEFGSNLSQATWNCYNGLGFRPNAPLEALDVEYDDQNAPAQIDHDIHASAPASLCNAILSLMSAFSSIPFSLTIAQLFGLPSHNMVAQSVLSADALTGIVNSTIETVIASIFHPDFLSYFDDNGDHSNVIQSYVASKVPNAFTSAQDDFKSYQPPEATTASTVDPAVQTDRNVPPRPTVPSTPVPPGHSDPQPAQIKNPYLSPPTAQGEVPTDALRRSPVNRDNVSTRDFANEEADGRSIASSENDTYGVRDTGDTASIFSLSRSLRRAPGAQKDPTMQTVPLAQPVPQQSGAIPQPQTAAYDTEPVDDPNSPYHEAGEPAGIPGQSEMDTRSFRSAGSRPRRFLEDRGMHGPRYPLDPDDTYNDAGPNDWRSMSSALTGLQAEVASMYKSFQSFQNSILHSLNSLNTRFDQMNSRLSEMTNALPGFTMSSNRSAAPPSSFQGAPPQTADPSAPVRPEEPIRQVQFPDQQGQLGPEQPVLNSNAPPVMAPQVRPDDMIRGPVDNALLDEIDAPNTAQAVKPDQSISGGRGTAPETERKAKGRTHLRKRYDPEEGSV